MGRLGADAFADQVNEGNASLRTALSWHLTSNHFPPLPTYFIPTCIAAIEAGQEENWDLEIPLPRGCATHKESVADDATSCSKAPAFVVVGSDDDCKITNMVEWKDGRDVVTAGALIESFHLDSFL
jgi:hypothetical protein